MIVFILVWIIAIIVFALDPKSPVKRWFSAALFLAGFYSFHCTLLDIAYLWLSHRPLLLFLENLIIYGASMFLFPYAFLMATLYYYNDVAEQRKKWRKPLALILLLPVIMMYAIIVFWLKDFNQPKVYLFMDLWVVPYYITANFLLFTSCLGARSRRQRNESFLTCIIAIPISLSDLIIGYILPGFGIVTNDSCSILIIILFMSFLCIVTRYGFLGRQLQIEKLQLDHSTKAMTSGAAILNHSIKNEIAKISICASNLDTVGQNHTQTIESARIILRSTGHILKMIERTGQCTRDLVLEKSLMNLKSFLEEILEEFQYQFTERKIEVTANLGSRDWITGDMLHLREVINNVIENAIEAMESGGRLDLKVTRSRGMVTIIIKDTGVGIPAGLIPHIFEPFFTTKNPKQNFGLGLLYCYQVLKKHGGTIEIESELNKGTTIYLNLPTHLRNRFCLAKGASYVPNKSISG